MATQTTVTGTFVDSNRNPIVNARVFFQAVSSVNGHPLSYQNGAGATVIVLPVSCPLNSAGSFSIPLDDVLTTNPSLIGYAVTVVDNATNRQLLGVGYGCIQPTGATWALPQYGPVGQPGVTVVAGPMGLPGSGANFVPALATMPGAVTTFNNVGTNLYDPTAEVESYLLASDGTLILDTASGNEAFTSGLMDTHGLTAIYVNFDVASTNHYAANGSFISQDANSRTYDANGVNNRIPIPSNAAHTRVCSLGYTTQQQYRMASSSNAVLLNFVAYVPPVTTGGGTLVIDCSLSNVQQISLADGQFWAANQVSFINMFNGQEITLRILFSADGNCGISLPSSFVNGKTIFAPGDGIVSSYGIVTYKWQFVGASWIPVRDAGSSSINGVTGPVTIAGAGVSTSGNTITIASSGTSGSSSVSPRIKSVSQLGGTPDCDLTTGLKIGGGTATDNVGIINTFLESATAANPVELIVDGPYGIHAGIVLPAGGYIKIRGLGPGTGLAAMPGANSTLIRNQAAAPFEKQGTPAAQIGYVELENFTLYGNRGDGTTGNSTTGNPRGYIDPSAGWQGPLTNWYCGIDLYALSRVVVRDVVVNDSPLYAMRLVNCDDVLVDNYKVYNPVAEFNCDGLHLSGPMSRVRINSANLLVANDDTVAINAPEGNGGNIDDVVMSGTITGISILRIYAGTWKVQRVRLHDFTATGLSVGFSLGIAPGISFAPGGQTIAAGQAGDFTAVNGTVTLGSGASCVNALGNSFDKISQTGITWLRPVSGSGFLGANSTGMSVGEFELGLTIFRDALGNSAPDSLVNLTAALPGGTGNNACTFNRFVIDDFQVVDAPGSSYASMRCLFDLGTSGLINELFIKSLNPAHVTAFVGATADWAKIAKIDGPGVAACGFQFPDANMAPNCMYISATGSNAGKLCIQHTAGTVTVLG